MSDQKDNWIESILGKAVEDAASAEYAFPDAVIAEFRALLRDELQQPQKATELEAIALRLGAANRGAK